MLTCVEKLLVWEIFQIYIFIKIFQWLKDKNNMNKSIPCLLSSTYVLYLIKGEIPPKLIILRHTYIDQQLLVRFHLKHTKNITLKSLRLFHLQKELLLYYNTMDSSILNNYLSIKSAKSTEKFKC